MEVPRIEKITLNMGVGEPVADKKVMEFALVICKRLPPKTVVTMSKKSYCRFKIREVIRWLQSDSAPSCACMNSWIA